MSIFLKTDPSSHAFPLGAHAARVDEYPPESVNIAVYAPEVVSITVVFRGPDLVWQSVKLTDFTDGVHHGIVGGMRQGALYAFSTGREVDVDPLEKQLLLDPYARAVETVDAPDGPVYWSVYVEHSFDWERVSSPRTPWRDTVIYEAHVKGLTQLHPEIPEELRGTYAGLAHPVMISYLQSLGITAVELLPVHFHIDEPHLVPLGLTNYWGYNTLGYFAPQDGYATEDARRAGPLAVIDEFKGMIKLLHAAGLEVILDVVYNHTAEGAKDRPALSWRGLGDEHYYRHDDGGRYLDTTGCGNTMNFTEPRVIQFVLDSLRYWVEEYKIDGFRFDLAVAMCRDESHQFTPRHPFLVAAGADKALRGIKLIAEPWDVGMGGWQTGNFPPGWADWNDRFRDTVRDFWLSDQAALRRGGEGASVARLAGCLAGSAEVFARSGRTAVSSINLVTAHDGFTLADLCSFDRKHNEDNGEQNRDGHNDNRSFNHGVEGPTENESILADRLQTSRNLMTTLLLSLGVPMITAGDEFGRTQKGNNNAYCQDNRLAWVDWSLHRDARAMLETTRSLLRIRQEFLAHQPTGFPTRKDSFYLLWFNAEGTPMTQDQWMDPSTRTVQVLLGSPSGILDGLVVINGGIREMKIQLPGPDSLRECGVLDAQDRSFELRYTTDAGSERRRGARLRAGEPGTAGANSVSVYRADNNGSAPVAAGSSGSHRQIRR